MHAKQKESELHKNQLKSSRGTQSTLTNPSMMRLMNTLVDRW